MRNKLLATGKRMLCTLRTRLFRGKIGIYIIRKMPRASRELDATSFCKATFSQESISEQSVGQLH